MMDRTVKGETNEREGKRERARQRERERERESNKGEKNRLDGQMREKVTPLNTSLRNANYIDDPLLIVNVLNRIKLVILHHK